MNKNIYLSFSGQYSNTYAYGDTNEGAQTGIVCNYLASALIRNGFTVKNNQNTTTAERIIESNNWNTGLHICVHSNACNKSVMGTRIFCYDLKGEGYKAAKCVFDELAPITPGTSESIKTATYKEILQTNAPVCYIEIEFHDTIEGAKWIMEHVEQIGETIAKGVCKYYGVNFISKGGSTVKTSADEVIKCAMNEIGYAEKETNYNLDSKTSNAGDGNYTKYARDLDAVTSFYNGRKNGYSWCDVFNDWCYYKTYGVDAAKKLLCQPDKSMGAGCDYSAKYYQNAGQWYKTPKAGDQIFFKTRTYAYAHTGIVYKVTPTMVYTIEGNTKPQAGVVSNGGMVCAKAYSINDASIVGYGRPNWDVVSTNQWSVVVGTMIPTNSAAKKYVQVQAQYVVYGDNCSAVKALQALLNSKGPKYNCGTIDGGFGAKTLAAVKAYQSDNGLSVDGEVGANTWKKLLA